MWPGSGRAPVIRPPMRTILLGLAAAALIGASYLILSARILSNALGCEEQTMLRTESPDHAKAVLVIAYRCGATTPDALGAFVLPSNLARSPDPQDAFLVADVDSSVHVAWEGNERVTIHVVGKPTGVSKRLDKALGVTINYSQ